MCQCLFVRVCYDNISAGVVYGIALIAVLWLCNILARYVFKICVNVLRYSTFLVILNCRDKLLIGYIAHIRMLDRNASSVSSNNL